MIILENDTLDFRFPDVHADARCSIGFQRTLRIPDDDTDYPLPPGLSPFPLRHLDDHAARLPDAWRRRGGVIVPMHQAEAMWIDFGSECGYPFAVKIATGKICALTGDTWVNHLNRDPQDYVVLPEQPWLDGYCVERGVIRQFVAMPLGEGYTVEEQLTGAAAHGGLQILAYPMKAERYEALLQEQSSMHDFDRVEAPRADMGLAPGGRMRQEIYDDPYSLDAWDQRHSSRCFIAVANSMQWMAMTGEPPPLSPPTARTYTDMGLPWFEYYGGDAGAVAGAEKFKMISSVAKVAGAKGNAPFADNETIDASHTIKLGRRGARQVREGAFMEGAGR